ncbi:hypothetical protein PG993_007786 [Apiospora rasikravindrae]|uniref:Uncharacterized protein n=1 Tax=Apiospora rasikravindrae TaxID=990691 RepID=A0ABR1SYH3_9PEZI
MSDNFDYVDFTTLLNQAAYLGTHATEPDPGQVSATDSAFLGDDSLLDWSFYADTQGTCMGPRQVANAHTEGLDLSETGVGVSDESFGCSANVGTLEFQPDFNQVTAPGSLYGGFDIDNTQPFVTGTDFGALSEPLLPTNSVVQGFAIGSVLDTPRRSCHWPAAGA